ncbi:hypothetical protein Goarm_000879, partial [Gossypium armourianum]|nr:hypothetical protein [Gossypium armourianum]
MVTGFALWPVTLVASPKGMSLHLALCSL